MEGFEWDENKNKRNQQKHRISFEEGVNIWKDPKHVIQEAIDKNGEERLMVTGKIENKMWTCFYTVRSPNRRIFSIRRARKKEVKLYD